MFNSSAKFAVAYLPHHMEQYLIHHCKWWDYVHILLFKCMYKGCWVQMVLVCVHKEHVGYDIMLSFCLVIQHSFLKGFYIFYGACSDDFGLLLVLKCMKVEPARWIQIVYMLYRKILRQTTT